LFATLFAGQSAKPVFAEQGGRLEVLAGRDVLAPEASQFVGNWFWRSGLPSLRAIEQGLFTSDSQLAWWAEPGRFQQPLGSFGGGNLTVQAGRDIVNLQAMVPSLGWADSRSTTAAVIQVRNGGDLTVSTGGNLLGGQFFIGRGQGRLEAAGTIDIAPDNAIAQAPLLALMDGQWRLSARQGLTVTAPFNPTAVATTTDENRPGRSGYYYTWGERSGLRLAANTGDIRLLGGINENQAPAFGLDTEQFASETFRVIAPGFSAVAAGGSIDLLTGDGQNSAVQFPSRLGQFSLWAADAISLGGARSGQWVMAGNNPADWPLASAPVRRDGNPASDPINGLLASLQGDRLPLTSLHAGNSEPVRIHAGGSLRIEGSSPETATLLLPKPARLSAGDDVVGLSLRTQNLKAGDVTSVIAGRNLLAQTFGRVEVAGPGALEVTAGSSVDLGDSGGIASSGNLRNPALSVAGATIRIQAAAAGRLNLAVLAGSYLAAPAAGGSPRYLQYRALLLAEVRAALQAPGLSYEQALQAFQTFPAAALAAFGQQVLKLEFAAVYLAGSAVTEAQMRSRLQADFERRKADLLAAGDAALQASQSLTLPGREVLRDSALADYLTGLRALSFVSLDLDSTVSARAAQLSQVQIGWRVAVAKSLSGTVAALDALAASRPNDPAALAYTAALGEFSGRTFDAYRTSVLASETAGAAAAASNFGRQSLPMRLALFDQGFAAAELAGAGSFSAQSGWPGTGPMLAYSGAFDMTQSSVITRRGGDISVINAGGAINVGLKDSGGADQGTPKGIIALGGGDIFGYAQGDFQVNTQRVFIVGQGDMNIWSSTGDIDSGRGANTAVAAPPLAPRRSTDGVVFEIPATTTGSGLGILSDANGNRRGSIGLYPALGEILALDAFIRAPAVVLGSTVKGADNLLSGSVGGAAAAVAAPPLTVTAPPTSSAATRAGAAVLGGSAPTQQRNALLTVELLGLGPAEEEACDDVRRREGRCPEPPK